MKTSELTDAALDWAVAEANGVHSDIGVNGKPWEPPCSTSWQESGPIIERENIALWPLAESQGWGARKIWGSDGEETGPTPLVAAMRCYVDSRLGNDVEIPEELKE